jgi:hypothetical protein
MNEYAIPAIVALAVVWYEYRQWRKNNANGRSEEKGK